MIITIARIDPRANFIQVGTTLQKMRTDWNNIIDTVMIVRMTAAVPTGAVRSIPILP